MDLQQAARPAGRPRDPGLDVAIRTAAIELIGEGGIDACALDEVARRAGVGKATIYRRWASKDSLVLDAFRNTLLPPLPTEDLGSLEAEARALLRALLAVLETPLARAARQLMPLLASRPDLAQVYRSNIVAAWDEALTALVARTVARGECTPETSPESALRAASALVTQRWLMQLGPVDETLTDRLVDDLVLPSARRG